MEEKKTIKVVMYCRFGTAEQAGDKNYLAKDDLDREKKKVDDIEVQDENDWGNILGMK